MGIKEDIRDLSPVSCLMIGAVFMVLYYFLVYDDGAAQVNEIATIQVDITQKELRLTDVRRAMANKEAFERSAVKLQKEMEQLLTYMPVELDMNQIQKDLTSRLQETNNKVQSMKNETVQSRFPGYSEYGLDIQSSGTYHDILSFLSVVTKMNRILDFKTLDFETLSATDEATTIQFKTLISVFSKNPNEVKEPSGPKK